jgi:hypothetical protein
MTHENFTFWFKGFIEGKQSLTQADIETIKAKSNEIVSEFKWDSPYVSPTIPYTSPPYDGGIIWCGTGCDVTTVNPQLSTFTFSHN